MGAIKLIKINMETFVDVINVQTKFKKNVKNVKNVEK